MPQPFTHTSEIRRRGIGSREFVRANVAKIFGVTLPCSPKLLTGALNSGVANMRGLERQSNYFG